MDILFLCHRIPYPPDKGDKIRSHALLKHLAKSHRVHLACFVDDPADMIHADAVKRIAGGKCLFVPLSSNRKWLAAARAFLSRQPITTSYFGSSMVSKWIKEVASTHHIERAVVFSSAMAPYIIDESKLDPMQAVLDLVDIDSDKWRQYARSVSGLSRWIYQREATSLLRLERAAARQFGATLLVSPYEAECFAAMAPESASSIHALSNGVNRDYFKSGEFPNPFPPGVEPIVMTGKMDYRPNDDGAKWFFSNVMPLLSQQMPRACFYVVGSNPSKSLQALTNQKLVLTGHVPDIRPYLQHASAVVAPLRIARGVQNKVLEAMAMTKPVVATQAATRALEVKSGTHLWIEDNPQRFANAVFGAARSKESLNVARNARNYVEFHHDWTRNLSALDELLDKGPQQSRRANQSLLDSDCARQDIYAYKKSAKQPSSAGAR